MEPLGMKSGDISSEQITASSQYNSNWSPERSRLHYTENGWTPSDDTIREWIQVRGVLFIQKDAAMFPCIVVNSWRHWENVIMSQCFLFWSVI